MTKSTIPDPALADALDLQLELIERMKHDPLGDEFTLTEMFEVLNTIKEALEDMRRAPFIEPGNPPETGIFYEGYREEEYYYFADIADDPMWGKDANCDFSDDEMGFAIGREDQLGFFIRTTPRTPEGLKELNRMRGWHAECRTFGLDPVSGAAYDYHTLEAFGAYQDALEQALTDDERAAAKATFTQIMRDAVAEDEAQFAHYLEVRALRGSEYPWLGFDLYAARRAKWAKTPAVGVIDATNAAKATNPIDATNAADDE